MARSHKRTHPRRKGGRGRKSGSIVKKLAAFGAPPLVLSAGGLAVYFYGTIEQADLAYCYERPDQHVSALFLDNSLTQLSAPQLRDYRAGFERAYKRAPVNTKLFFFTTASDVQGSLAKPVFAICKPPATAPEQLAIGAPSKPTPYLKRRADEARAAYSKAVDKVLADAQDPAKAAGDSPILEQLQAISRFDGFAGPSRSLTVITDSIQNSEVARFCTVKGAMPPYARFKNTGAYRIVKPNPFTGTAVSVLLVENFKLPQLGFDYCSNDELRKWLPDYFKGNGAQSVELTRLRHWAGS